MKATVVRYQAKPDRADENQQLMEAVFAELSERRPRGFSYRVFRLEDGVSFVHVVTTAASAEASPLLKLAAFQRFIADIKSRVEEAPVTTETQALGFFDSFA